MTYRWLDAEHTMVRRESDGACIPADATNRDYAALLAEGAEIAPFQRWADLGAAKAELTAAVEARARQLRVAVAGTDDATKLAVYREKYAVALAALSGGVAAVEAVAAFAPEAAARGESPSTLAALVKFLGDQWRAAGMAIDAASQAHKRAITALASVEEAEAYDIEADWPF